MRFRPTLLLVSLSLGVICARGQRSISPTPSPFPDFRTVVSEKLRGFVTKKMVNGKLEESRIKLENVCPIDTDPTTKRIFAEYGAIFVAQGVIPPPLCIFSAEYQVQAFQGSVATTTTAVDGVNITLQEAAMTALTEGIVEASKSGVKITPRGGSSAARRSYDDTISLWNTRFLPGLRHWVSQGRLTKKEAKDARWLPTEAQVTKVLEWEDRKIFFSKDFSKSILYSVAAPGASQHISMLAIDIIQFADKRVRDIMARHGWFQTVRSDLPHFTYLGFKKMELPGLGLKPVMENGQEFWIPDLRQ